MRTRAAGRAALAICLALTGSLLAEPVEATPIGVSDSAAAPSLALPQTALGQAGSTPGAGGAERASTDASGKTATIHDDLPAGSRLPTADEKPPGAPGRVAALSASVVALEEDPKVDLGEVIRSVFRSTADAVPWLHLAPPQAVDHRFERLAAERESRLESAVRFDEAGDLSGDADRRAAGHNGDANRAQLPSLSREVVQFARELIDNPLAWMFGFLALLSGVALSFVRGRDRSGG